MIDVTLGLLALATWPALVLSCVLFVLLVVFAYNDSHTGIAGVIAVTGGLVYYFHPEWLSGVNFANVGIYLLLGVVYVLLESVRNWYNVRRCLNWMTAETAKNPRFLIDNNWDIHRKMAREFYQKFTHLYVSERGVKFGVRNWIAGILMSCVILWPFHFVASLLSVLFGDLFRILGELFRDLVELVYERTLKKKLDALNAMFAPREP